MLCLGYFGVIIELYVIEFRGEDIYIVCIVLVIVFFFCLSWVLNVIFSIFVLCGVFMFCEVYMFGVYMMFFDFVINLMMFGIRNREI